MGIANIVNTAGGGGGSSEIITHLVNSVDGAGLRLANQGYISCADVSANRLGTNDFSVEWVISQETRAANADLFFSNLNGSNQPIDSAVIRWDVSQDDNIELVFTNSSALETAYNFGYDPAPDLNEPTHYVISADRSGNAVLYRNGAEIASVSIAASGSANLGNSGHPSVVGSPVNNMGAIGNVYRFRTYSKALSSDEAKNVFDRADVPTALVSNLLLDLDCAYANPTQSTVIQDRGPNNQDGTLNGTITQTNVIKQLNSVSARIGTTAATPADNQLIVGAGSGLAQADADDIILTGGSSVNAGITLNTPSAGGYLYFADGNSGDALYRGFLKYVHSSDTMSLGTAAAARLTIDTNGRVHVGAGTASQVNLNVTGTSGTGGVLCNALTSGFAGDGDTLGSYGFKCTDSANTLAAAEAKISAVAAEAHSGTTAATDLVFYTKPSGTGPGSGPTARLTIDSSGNVNISGLAASSDVQTDGSKNLITSSDKRLKNDIGELTAGLDIISNLQPHYFSWKNDETNTQQLGFYAQDVYEFLPEAAPREQKQNLVSPAVAAEPATYYEEGDELPEGKAVGDEKTPAVEAVEAVYEPVTNDDGTPDYNWGFNGRPIIAALVAAVKELKAKVETLENA